jgi:sugar phosphate permease
MGSPIKPAATTPETPSGFHGPPSRVRYLVLAVACSLALLTYLDRLGFNVAASAIGKDLGLDDEDMGYAAAAFLIAYASFQVPGGLLSDKLGGRSLLTLLVLGWSLFTGLLALAVLLPPGSQLVLVFLLGMRFLFGMFQAGGFPALARVLADWMPARERASAQGWVWTFSRLGGALIPFFFRWLVNLFGTWTTAFWLLAGAGILWCVPFWRWFRNRPEEMKGVNAAEIALIAADRAPAAPTSERVPWRQMVGSVNVWALCLMYGFVGFAGNFITNMLPLYLTNHRHLSETATDWLSALPLAFGIVSCVLGGVLSDWIIRRWGSRKWGRRLNGAVGLGLAGLAMLSTIWVEEVWLLGLLFSAAFFFNDLNMGPAWAACADIGERSAATISGAMNMLGSLAGAAGAAFAGYFFRRHEPDLVFVVFAVSYGLASLCWLAVDVTKPLVNNQKEPMS